MIKIGDLNQSILGSKVILCSSQESKNIKDRGLEEKQQKCRRVTFARAVLEKGAQHQKRKAEKKVEKVSENVFAM